MNKSLINNQDMIIREIEPVDGALIQKALQNIIYSDAHEVKLTTSKFDGIDHFSREFFLAQPFWLRAVSMGIFSRERLVHIISLIGFESGEKVGTWKIYDRNEKEIVFGESLGFMTYRFSLRLIQQPDSDTIIASTVAQVNNIFGKTYFSLILLFHRRFVRLMLKNALHL